MREYVVRDKKGKIRKLSKEEYRKYKKKGKLPNFLEDLFG